MIKLPKGLYMKILNYAKSALPEEACGLLGGEIRGEEKTVKSIYFLENTDHSCAHFSVNSAEQFNAVRSMRSSGTIPLGNFHSHPDAPPLPSNEDKLYADDCNASYLILSLINEPCLKSFHIADGTLIEEELIIE